MSSRRSTRLSAASSNVKSDQKVANETTTPSKGAPKDKVTISKKRKNINDEKVDSLLNGDDASSSTAKKNRVTKSTRPVKPATATTSVPSNTRDTRARTPPPPANRLAVPNGTNAPLISPETHRLVVNKTLDQISPSKASVIKTTTGNILDEAVAHLIKMEPKLKSLIERNPCAVFSPRGLSEEIDPFNALTSGIISQQVSGAAAKSIKAKFVALFNSDISDASLHVFPTPSQVSASSIEVLRTAGLSQRKAEYIHGLAQKFTSGELTTSMLFSASYEEVLEELIKVRGLGKWSVEMFACFGLKRMDVFSTGDLGVQRGMAAFMGRDISKLKGKGGKWKYMSENEMLEIADKFKPYRSVFMWYMWRVEEVDISTFEN